MKSIGIRTKKDDFYSLFCLFHTFFVVMMSFWEFPSKTHELSLCTVLVQTDIPDYGLLLSADCYFLCYRQRRAVCNKFRKLGDLIIHNFSRSKYRLKMLLFKFLLFCNEMVVQGTSLLQICVSVTICPILAVPWSTSICGFAIGGQEQQRKFADLRIKQKICDLHIKEICGFVLSGISPWIRRFANCGL